MNNLGGNTGFNFFLSDCFYQFLQTAYSLLHHHFNLLFYLYISVFSGFSDITPLYCKHSPRNFSPSLIGYFFAEVLFAKGVGAVLMIPFMTKCLKVSDFTIAICGALMSVVFYIVLASASTKWLMFVGKYQ